MDWSTIPECPSLMCKRGNTEGANSSKILCLMFCVCLLHVKLCQDLFCGFQGICGLMTCVKSKWVNKRQIEVCFSPDVILCGWLGSKCQLTNYLSVCLHISVCMYVFRSVWTSEGRLGMSDVSPLSGISGLSFDSTLLFPLLFFCLVLLPFLSYLFFCLLALSSKLFQKILQYFL